MKQCAKEHVKQSIDAVGQGIGTHLANYPHRQEHEFIKMERNIKETSKIV